MNKLSWFLYLADVVASVKVVLTFITIASIITWLILLLGWILAVSEDQPDANLATRLLQRVKTVSLIATILLLATVFIPSKETVLSIAASETTERVLHSTESKEILSKLKVKILERMK